MSTFILIIFFSAFYIFDFIVEVLNIKALDPIIPKEFRGVYDSKKYKKSQLYLKENTIFGLVESGVSLILLSGFIAFGGFAWLDAVAQNQGLVFAGILLILGQLISLPFDLYKTFVIEQKYGFNKTTLTVFLTDLIKNLLLTIAIGGVVFAAILWFFGQLSSMAWLIAWIFITIVQLTLYLLAPVLFLPLFNKFTPLPNGKLKTAIENFAKKQHFIISGILKMDSSRRTTKANAFFTGIGKFRRIALFDTLIKNHTTEELVSVLAHEIGHYKKRHVVKQLVIGIFVTGASLFGVSQLMNNPIIFSAFGLENYSIYASVIFAFLLYTPLFEIMGIFMNILHRKFEYEADRFAVESYGKKAPFISALKKLSKSNLSNLTPHPLKVFVEYSHPPLLERIRAIRSIKSVS